MTDLMNDMTYMYMNIGVTGLVIVVGCVLLVWYFTKGRKEAEASRTRIAEEYARTSKIIENCTAVIANNTAVIEANTSQRQDEKRCLESIADRMQRHGEQLDEIQKNQAVCMDRQRR